MFLCIFYCAGPEPCQVYSTIVIQSELVQRTKQLLYNLAFSDTQQQFICGRFVIRKDEITE